MLQVNKNTLSHLVSYKKTIFCQNKYFDKYDMTFANLQKTLNYLRIQEILLSENFTGYYLLIKEYFICSALTRNLFRKLEIIYFKLELNHLKLYDYLFKNHFRGRYLY